MVKQNEFTPGYAIEVGPNGNAYVASTTDRSFKVSIRAFLYSNFNPWTAEQKAALRGALGASAQ